MYSSTHHQYQCATDPTLLEDLALSGAFPDIAWQQPQPPRKKMAETSNAARTSNNHSKGASSKKKKQLHTLSFSLHAPSTTIRQALFPTGPGSYPSPTVALQQQPSQFEHHRFQRDDAASWTCSGEMPSQQTDNRRRETGWNTSFPAEYTKANLSRDFQQTLAYQEQFNRLQSQNEAMAGSTSKPPVSHFGQSDSGGYVTGATGGYAAPDRQSRAPGAECDPQSIEELSLLKQVTMREGLLSKLTTLVKSAAHEQDFGVERGNELLHLLLQLRDASVQVVQAVAIWHASLRPAPCAFWFDGKNYCLKMVSDLNFLAKTKCLGQILGVNPARMKQNPFMMPAPIPERDFHAIQALTWSKTQRMFSSDPVERVTDAEKYLVWCLVHLADPAGAAHFGSTSPTAVQSNYAEKGATTWQKRAEKQLQMLSMPLEAPTGQMHLMDSSRMMKRKGYLPSLSLSPPKTLTDLMDTVHSTQPAIERRVHSLMHLRAYWNGIEFSTNSTELETLGALESPPHHMVTLVAASILILLSPSDRIPKDFSWTSCRKMLLSGARLVELMEHFEVGTVPSFKLKALVPFLQNEHFQPKFLNEFSHAAGVLCAWVFAALAKAQNQETVSTSRSDEDRLDLLGELEIEDGFEETQAKLHAAPEEGLRKSKSAKRVTIGNAEVLFINENQPVSSCSLSASSPRPASRAETPQLANKKKSASMLLRTSPWTFHGVTYFVSFFLEQAETALSIKLYEPMSSVESQIFVTEDDLEADFGTSAFEFFQSRDYRPLCDLILSRLDGMMTGSSKQSNSDGGDGGGEQKQQTAQPSIDRCGNDELREPEVDDETATCSTPRPSATDLLEQDEEYEGDEDENENEEKRTRDDAIDPVLRIQCAARQRLARDKVQRVRFEKEKKHELVRSASAVRIQSMARQRLAKKEVARRRLESRRPTDIPSQDMIFREKKEVEHVLEPIADEEKTVTEEDGEEKEETAPVAAAAADPDPDQEARPPPVGHFESKDEIRGGGGDEMETKRVERPETVMSYASDQFEDDDFEDE